MLKYFFAINLSILVCFLLFKMYQSKKESFTTCDHTCPQGQVKHTLNIGNEDYIKCCPPNQYASVNVGPPQTLSCTGCPSVNDAKYNGKYDDTSSTGQIGTDVIVNTNTTIGHCQATCRIGNNKHYYSTVSTDYKDAGDPCGSYTKYTSMTSNDTITVSGSDDLTYHSDDMKKRTTDYTIDGDEPCNGEQIDATYCCVSGKEPRKNGTNIKCCGSNEYLDGDNNCTRCPDPGNGSYSNDGINACYITGNECINKGYTVNGGATPEYNLVSPSNDNTPIYHLSAAPPGSYNCKMYECSFDTNSAITTPTINGGYHARPLKCRTEKMYDNTTPLSLSTDTVSNPDTDTYAMFYANVTTNTLPQNKHSKYKNSSDANGEYAKYYLCPTDNYLREDEGSSASPTKYGCCPPDNSLSNDECIDLSSEPTKAIENTALKEGDRTGDCLPYYYQVSPGSVCTKCEYDTPILISEKYKNDTMWEQLEGVELDTTKISSELSSDSDSEVTTVDQCKKKCLDNDHNSSSTNDCRLIEFTPSTPSTPAGCKLYDLPKPTPSSSPPSDTDNGEWFQSASSPSSKELYLLNCASGTNNLTHYQYKTSTTPDCIGKMLMKQGSESDLTDFPRYCHWKACEIKSESTDRDNESNTCFPRSEAGSNIYCTNTAGNNTNQCLTLGDLKDDCELHEEIAKRHTNEGTSIPTSEIYQYSKKSVSSTKTSCTEADMDDCECALTPCSEGEYVSENNCVSCTSPEYVNSEGTGCASFFIDQTKYFYIKQGNSYINEDKGKLFLTTDKTSAFIFKITDSTDNHTVTLQSGNDKLYVKKYYIEDYISTTISYAVGFDDGNYHDYYEGDITANPNNYFQLEIIESCTETECKVKIYNAVNSKFLMNNATKLDLQDTYEDSTCEFTLEFITCPAGYEISVSDKICKETAETYNERLRNILKASYDDCHVEFKGANNATYAIVNKYNRSEWMEGNREYGGDDPWDNLETGNHWSGPAPYLRNSDLTKEYYNAKVFGRNLRFDLDNWGTSSSVRIMLVGRNCCFREYEHPIGTPGGNPNTETCNNGTPQQEAKKQATLSAVDIWLRSPEDHVPDDQKLRKTEGLLDV